MASAQISGDYRTRYTGAQNWNTASNWEVLNGATWSTASTIPTSTANVYIQNGAQYTLNTSTSCASLIINTGNANTFVTISGTNSLTVAGAVTINAPSTNNRTKYIAVNAGTLSCSSVTMTAPGADTRDSYISVSTGTINVSGNITMNGTAARNQIVMTGSGTLNVTGTGTITGGTISSATGGYTALTNGTVNYSGTNQTVGNYVYYNLGLNNSGTKTLPATLSTINGNFRVDNCTAVAQSALTIGGNVVLANGYNMTWGAFTHNVGGSWTRTGYGSSTFTGSTVNFTGSTSATISEVAYSNTFENITISKSGTLALGANLAITGGLTVNSGSTFNLGGNNLTVGGDVTLNSGSTWNESSAGTYSFAGNFTNNATTFTTSTGTHNFTGSSKVFSGSKATSIPNLTLSGSYTNSGTLTVDNTFGGNGSLTNTGTLNIGGTAWNINLTANAVGNTVNYTGASGQTLRPGSYYNLTLVGGGTKTFPSAITIANELFIFSGTLADLGSNFVHTANTLNLNGTAQASNTYGGSGSTAAIINSSYFTANTGIVNTANTWTGATNTDWSTASNWSKGVVPTASVAAFVPNVTNQPVINSSATCAALNVLSGSSVTLNGSNSLTVSGNINNAGTITLNSGTLELTGSFSGSGTLNTNTGTVVYSGAAQTVANVNYYNLTLSGSGNKTLQTGTTSITGNLTLSGTAAVSTVTGLTVAGDVTLGAGTSLSDAGNTITVAGNWANNGSSYSATGTLKMTGAGKTIGGSSLSMFNNLTLENNASPVLLGANAIVNSTLTLNGGILKLGSYNLTLSSGATISGWYLSSAAMVVADGTGELRRIYSGTGSFTFPIGDNSDGGANYTPVTVNVTAGTFSAAYVGVRVTDAKHPNNGATDNYLSRYWSISQSGITGMLANVSATYLPEDVVGTEAAQTAMRYAGSAWTGYSTLGSSTLSATGVNTFGDFTGFKVQRLFRSRQNGNWNSSSTWEYSVDGASWAATSSTPSSADDGITIQSGHTVTVTSGVSIDQTVVNAGGQLTVNGGVTLTVANGADTDLLVNGTLANAGTITTTGTLAFEAGSTYQHTTNGGTIPTATWDVSSNCLITGTTGTAPLGLTQTFGNFTWNCTNQTASVNLAGNLSTVNGNFTISSTNASQLQLTNGTSSTLSVAGNFSMTAGTLNFNSGANIETMNLKGNFTHSGGTITESGSGSGSIIFSGTSTQTYTSGGTILNTINFIVNSGATLQMAAASTTVSGAGSFTLSSGATLGVTSANGIVTGTTASGNIQVTGTRTYSTGVNYIYNRTDGTQVTGNGLNQNVPANLTINNSNGVTLSAATSVSGILTMTSGNLTTTTTNLLTLTNTSETAVSGGSSSSYVNGPLKWTLPSSSTGGGTYIFPVGAGTVYRPFTLVNPSTGTGTVTAQVQTITGTTGGTFDATLSAKSTAEYWLLTTAGNFSGSSASIERPTAISPYNAIATSTTIAGTYTNIFGTASTNGVANSAIFTGVGSRYFVFGQSNTGIYTTTTSLAGFTYKQNLGPSTAQNFSVGGIQLSENLHLEMKWGNFEISSSNTPFTGVTAINLPIVNQSVATTPVYVRLKAGLTAGNYTDTIYVSSAGYTTKIITLTGTVTSAPNVSVSPSSLSLGSYSFGGGPTAAQNITVTASRLSGVVTVTPPAGFEIKLNASSTYQTTALSIAANYPVSGSDSLTSTIINVRLAAGLGSGTHSGNIVVASSGATSKNVALSGTVNPSAAIYHSTSFLGAFVYTYTTGTPIRKIQGFKLDVKNLASGSYVRIIAPKSPGNNFEISRTRNGTFVSDSIVVTNLSGTFSDSIFVRLKTGLSVGLYNNRSLTIKASGAVTKSVGLNGSVVNAASLLTSAGSLTGFGYQYYNGTPSGILHGGPSSPQSFVVAGSSLSSAVTVALTDTNFVISRDGTNYVSSIPLSISSGVLDPTTIYVRLKSGRSVGTYSGNVTITSGTASSAVSLNGAKVYASPVILTNSGGDYCVGSSINLTSVGQDVENFYWEGPNSFYSSTQNATLTSSATTALSGDYIVTGNVSVGGNLIYNGNFENGFVGFGSSYNYRDSTYSSGSSYGPLYNEGDYTIVSIPHNVHTNFTYNGPKSGKKQMVVNGSPTAGVVVWSQSVAVIPNSRYQFTYWEQTVELPSPSQLQLYVNGEAAGPVYTASSTKGVWTKFLYNAYSGSNDVLNLELVNQNTIAGGNDFALDSIEMHQVLDAKDTATIVVGSSLPVSVSIAASQNPATSGVPVTLTATPTNGGFSPIYKWVIGTDTVQSSSSPTLTRSFTSTTTVKCILVSSLKCVTGNPANSSITITVNAVVNPNYWLGALSTDWANTANWTDSRIPAAGEDVIYADSTIYSSNAMRDLWVDGSRVVGNVINRNNRKVRLVIPAGKQLIVNNNIEFKNKSTDLIVIKASATEPNGTLIFNNAQNNPVYATVEMYSKATWNLSMPVNQKYNWQFFGIPVSTLTASPTLDKSYVRQMLEEKDNINNHWELLTNNSVLTPFRGYEICQEAPKTYTFTGQINNSNFSSGQLVKTTTGNPLYPGQHLLANSYTAAIKVKNIEFGSDMEQTVYIYNTGTFSSWQGQTPTADSLAFVPGQYNSVPRNQAGVAGLLQQVPSMSAFLVRINKTLPASTANCYVNINYGAAVVRNVEKQRIGAVDTTTQATNTIRVIGENGADKLWLMSDDGYSDGYDNGYDGYKIEGSAINPQLYAYSNGDKLQINSVSDLNNSALVFRAGQDNEYTMIFNHDEKAMLKYTKIFLHDLKTNSVTDVTMTGSKYNFSASSAEGAVLRFRLLASKKVDNNQKVVQSTVYSNNNRIYVQNLSDESGKVYLYDVTGRTIGVKTIGAYENISFPDNGIQTYVVKRVIGEENETSKIIIR